MITVKEIDNNIKAIIIGEEELKILYQFYISDATKADLSFLLYHTDPVIDDWKGFYFICIKRLELNDGKPKFNFIYFVFKSINSILNSSHLGYMESIKSYSDFRDKLRANLSSDFVYNELNDLTKKILGKKIVVGLDEDQIKELIERGK